MTGVCLSTSTDGAARVVAMASRASGMLSAGMTHAVHRRTAARTAQGLPLPIGELSFVYPSAPTSKTAIATPICTNAVRAPRSAAPGPAGGRCGVHRCTSRLEPVGLPRLFYGVKQGIMCTTTFPTSGPLRRPDQRRPAQAMGAAAHDCPTGHPSPSGGRSNGAAVPSTWGASE